MRTPGVNVFGRLARFVVARRWWGVAAGAVVLLLALPFAPQAGGALQAGGFSSDQLESARARHALETELALPPSALAIVFHSDTLKAGAPAFEVAAAAAIADVATAPHVVRVV